MPLRPWDFPIGSVESRIAVRLQLSRYNDNRKHITIIHRVPRPNMDASRINVGNWQEWPHGELGRMVYVPHAWRKTGEPVPTCPDCGAPFKLVSQYSEMCGYEADCLRVHDPEPPSNTVSDVTINF